jgi:hypothetical protein
MKFVASVPAIFGVSYTAGWLLWSNKYALYFGIGVTGIVVFVYVFLKAHSAATKHERP